MTRPLILASGSETRRQMLRAAGVPIAVEPARVDEDGIRESLAAEGAHPRDQADLLADLKARKIAERHPDGLVLGADQILALKDRIFTKPETPDAAREQLCLLRGQTHHLYSAAVLYDRGEPVWRHIGTVRLTMRNFSDAFLDAYIVGNWPAIAQSAGGYQVEAAGIGLFERIEGDHFSVLGLPLLPLLTYLQTRGFIPS